LIMIASCVLADEHKSMTCFGVGQLCFSSTRVILTWHLYLAWLFLICQDYPLFPHWLIPMLGSHPFTESISFAKFARMEPCVLMKEAITWISIGSDSMLICVLMPTSKSSSFGRALGFSSRFLSKGCKKLPCHSSNLLF